VSSFLEPPWDNNRGKTRKPSFLEPPWDNNRGKTRRPKLPILSTYPRHNSGLHVSYREARVVRLLLNRLLCVSLIMPSSASAALYAKFGLSPNDEGDYRKVLATIPSCANADRSIPDVEHIHVTAKRDVDRMLHAFNRDVVCRIDKEAQRTSVDPSNDGLSA